MASMMASIFKKKKSPEQIVELLKKDLTELPGEDERHQAKLQEDIGKRVAQMRAVIYGDPDASEKEREKEEEHRDEHVAELARALMAAEVMPVVLTHLKVVDFEARKSVAAVFAYLLRGDVQGFATSYMPLHTSMLAQMVDGYSSPEVALSCGAMLRECIGRYPRLHEALLYGVDGGISKPLRDLFEEHVHNPNFEVAADAFETLTTLLTSNRPSVFRFLNPDGDEASRARYAELFALYNGLLQSDNYVLKRQSLKLLSEFLLDRENFRIMMRYISDRSNLKVIMLMLRHNQPNIQFEAFHVFKVFVANPEKPGEIADILAANKAKLIAFLQGFQNEKDDEQFTEEKALLIEQLSRLPDIAVPGAPAAPAGGAGASAGQA